MQWPRRQDTQVVHTYINRLEIKRKASKYTCCRGELLRAWQMEPTLPGVLADGMKLPIPGFAGAEEPGMVCFNAKCEEQSPGVIKIVGQAEFGPMFPFCTAQALDVAFEYQAFDLKSLDFFWKHGSMIW